MTTTEPTTGRDALQAIRDGGVPPPPAADALGLELREVRDGATVFSFRPDGRFDNGTGLVHGGILSAVADFGVTTAIMSALPAGSGLVTSNLNVTFVRPLAIGGENVTCEGSAIHIGQTVAHAEATIRDSSGEVLVLANATCRLWRPDRI